MRISPVRYANLGCKNRTQNNSSAILNNNINVAKPNFEQKNTNLSFGSRCSYRVNRELAEAKYWLGHYNFEQGYIQENFNHQVVPKVIQTLTEIPQKEHPEEYGTEVYTNNEMFGRNYGSLLNVIDNIGSPIVFETFLDNITSDYFMECFRDSKHDPRSRYAHYGTSEYTAKTCNTILKKLGAEAYKTASYGKFDSLVELAPRYEDLEAIVKRYGFSESDRKSILGLIDCYDAKTISDESLENILNLAINDREISSSDSIKFLKSYIRISEEKKVAGIPIDEYGLNFAVKKLNES